MLLCSPKVDRDLAIPPQTLGRFPWGHCHLTCTPRRPHSAGPFSIAATPLFSHQPARTWLYALVCSLITCTSAPPDRVTVHLSACLCPARVSHQRTPPSHPRWSFRRDRILLTRITPATCLCRVRRLSTTPRPTGHAPRRLGSHPLLLKLITFRNVSFTRLHRRRTT